MSREVVITERIDVEALPRRTAHAVHALIVASDDAGMPLTAAEVCVRDEESLSVRGTAAALREASKLGLAERWMYPYWNASFLALEHKKDFEARFLRETAEHFGTPVE